ncbi:uncharacterized protein LOC134271712 isoform X2 [Saccostrea cucullata]|uniref:uncharacterized protein LOC134271712 isoform X2 n=1 Tax=Saccostrea cuccullata TaxID=36930 RepID=UPI002ED538E3
MTYNGFGYTVNSCPLNETEFNESAKRLNCSVDENGRSQYTCVPNTNKTALVEFCYKFTVGLYEKGNCLETLGYGFLDQVSCHHFQEGCPANHFKGTDLYKYPECLNINTHQQCYFADPSCPNTSQFTTTNITFKRTEEQVFLNTGAIVGGIVSVIFFLFVILAIVILRKRRLRHRIYQRIRIRFVFGGYVLWRTNVSDVFSKLTPDEVCILLCFLSTDSDCPNFTKTESCEWLRKLNVIRLQVYGKRNRLTTDKVQNSVTKLKSIKFLYDDEGELRITKEVSDETIYRIGKQSRDILFHISSFMTAKKYLRSMEYNRKIDEKCVNSNDTVGNSVLISRLQMDIISHPTIEDTSIFPLVSQICKYHALSHELRSLLYSLLLLGKYALKVNEESHAAIFNKLRERYFTDLPKCTDIGIPAESLSEISQTQENEFTFQSDTIRHDVMYAFVTECLTEDGDLEFFLSTASHQVILEYCRSWKYERSEGERCLYVPSWPEKLYDLFIDRLQIDTIIHCQAPDKVFCDAIQARFNFPKEITDWNKVDKQHYVELSKRGTQTVHQVRGMIVGCAGAGKTTLLKRLLGRSTEEILNVKPTKGLDVHEEIFEISNGKLEESLRADNLKIFEKFNGNEINESAIKTVTFFDFGGQCAYYACHQIYLTRRAFYVLVLDASKNLTQVVDERVCDQKGTVFSGWTYGNYFLFWLNSIHTYCFIEGGQGRHVDVVIVASHWDEKIYKDKADLLDSLLDALQHVSNLSQYIREDRCFPTQLLSDPIRQIEKILVEIADLDIWEEDIPHEWLLFDHELQLNKKKRHILPFEEITEKMSFMEEQRKEKVEGMLRYYHDAGKILYFNEEGLSKNVIIDVQWFVDAFKIIITDRNHIKGIIATMNDWNEYNDTGYLKKSLLCEIWKKEDENLFKNFDRKERSVDIQFDKDSRFLSYHTEELLSYMQKLGLLFIGSSSLYVPCMNKRSFKERRKQLGAIDSQTSILVFYFEFFPFFIFCRLIVKLTQIKNWTVLTDGGKSCLYNNAAIFKFKEHYISVAMKSPTIQLQIFKPDSKVLKDVTILIRKEIEHKIMQLTRTFYKQLKHKVGYSCKNDQKKILGYKVKDDFLEETLLRPGRRMTCPQHPIDKKHTISPNDLMLCWK